MSEKKLSISFGVLQRRYGPKEALEICAKAGFDAVDFDLDSYGFPSDPIYKKSDEEIVEYFKDIKKRADELGIIIGQTHGKCKAYVPDDDAYNEWVYQASRRDLLATAALGAPACVIHNIMQLRWGKQTPEFLHAKNKEFFDDLIPFAEEYGTAVALETFGDTCPNGVRTCEFFGDVHELKKQYDMLDTKNKALCMDTGHSHHCAKYGMTDTVEAIYYLNKDITLLHLNDNNGHSDQHLPPLLAGSESGLNWKEVMKALDDIEYKGFYNFEISLYPYGKMLEDTIYYFGKYLRKFIDGTL